MLALQLRLKNPDTLSRVSPEAADVLIREALVRVCPELHREEVSWYVEAGALVIEVKAGDDESHGVLQRQASLERELRGLCDRYEAGPGEGDRTPQDPGSPEWLARVGRQR